ncbi:Hsp20/alpha crystallin family protein [Gracilibacillus xinjiangensis]|uniref:Hsp20/alpha crystallin family protein n=1 Tax=Gracilibacillus xinjiangensis TaxID=1193282 RepID=A0ABV8WU48_9BACI
MDNKEKRSERLPVWGDELIRKLDAFIYDKPTRNIMGTIDQFFERARGPERIPADILETEKEWLVRVDLPGVKKEQIQLAVHGSQLLINISHKEETEHYDQTYHYYRKERKEQYKERTITLPYMIDKDKVKVTFTNGVLQIKGPKNSPDEKYLSID